MRDKSVRQYCTIALLLLLQHRPWSLRDELVVLRRIRSDPAGAYFMYTVCKVGTVAGAVSTGREGTLVPS